MPEPPPYESDPPNRAFVTDAERRPTPAQVRPGGAAAGQAGETTRMRSPPSTCWWPPMASALDGAADRGGDVGLHLHRLDGRHHAAGLDGVALGDGRGDHAGERRRHVAGLARVGLLDRLDVGRDRAVAHLDGPELAVEGAHDGAHAVPVGVADAADAEQQALAGLDLGLVLAALLQAVQELDGAEHRQVAEAARGCPRTPWWGRGRAAGSRVRRGLGRRARPPARR